MCSQELNFVNQTFSGKLLTHNLEFESLKNLISEQSNI